MARPDSESSLPAVVEEAEGVVHRFRQKLGLGVGGLTLGVLALSALGVPAGLPIFAVGLLPFGVAWIYPPSARVRRARALVEEWEETGRVPLAALGAPVMGADGAEGPGAALDPRLPAAEALVGRILAHAGAGTHATTAAEELLELMHGTARDLEVVRLLRTARADGPGAERRRARADALETRLDARMDEALDTAAELFEGVVSADQGRLREALTRVQERLRELDAHREVEALLGE